MGLMLFVGLFVSASAQLTSPALTSIIREDSATATTVFLADSVYLGYPDYEKWIQVVNDGSVVLYFALGNDTAAGKFIRVKNGTTENVFTISRLSRNVKFIRSRAVSSTCIRRVRWGIAR